MLQLKNQTEEYFINYTLILIQIDIMPIIGN